MRTVACLVIAAAAAANACGPAATGTAHTAAGARPVAVYCLDYDRWPRVFTRDAVIARGVFVPARDVAAAPDEERAGTASAGYVVRTCEFDRE